MSSSNGNWKAGDCIDRRTVVVTGASGGVGRAVVRRLGEKGCKVGLVARGRDGLEGAKRDVEVRGGKGLVFPADVSNADQVEAAAEAVEREFGPIDVWINDAMVSMYAPFWEISPEEYRHITEVTYLGQVYGTMSALKRMRPRDRGVIVQVGSALVERSIPLQSAYCGGKHAIQGFTESIRSELIHEKSRIGIVIVDLPGVNTTQFEWTKNRMPHKPRPTGPIFQPEVAADGILFAAEHPYRKKLIVGGPADPNHRDNFWEPLPGDHGSHGPFDAQALDHSMQLWATKHRTGLFATLAAVGIGAAVAAIGYKNSD